MSEPSLRDTATPRCPTCGGSDQAFEDGRSFERGVIHTQRDAIARALAHADKYDPNSDPRPEAWQAQRERYEALADVVLAVLGDAP